MSSHRGKLLELLAIEDRSSHQFIHIKFSLQEDIEVLWKIDDYTADKLRPIAKFDGKHKYRLSLNSSWNDIKKQHITTLTRTYLNTSERVYFSCSENYVNQLSSIKRSHGIHDLDIHVFTPIPFESVYQPEPEHKQPKKNVALIYIFFLIICFLLSILVGYSSLTYLSKPSFNEHIISENLLP